MPSEQSTQCHALWIIRPGALTLVMIAALTGVRIWVCGKTSCASAQTLRDAAQE